MAEEEEYVVASPVRNIKPFTADLERA